LGGGTELGEAERHNSEVRGGTMSSLPTRGRLGQQL